MAQSDILQMTVRFTELPWKLVKAILKLGAGPYWFCKYALPQSYWDRMQEKKPKRLQLEADTFLRVVKSITLLKQVDQ